MHAAEEDRVVGCIDRVDDDRSRGVRARSATTGLVLLAVAGLDDELEELRRARRRPVLGDGHLLAREDADAERFLSRRSLARSAPSEPSDTSTVGGSADTDANAVTVIPHGRSSSRQVTSTTPLASVLIASANSAWLRTGAFVVAISSGQFPSRRTQGGWRPLRSHQPLSLVYAVVTSTVTGTPFVTMSKTAERCCARSTTSRSFSSGASPATRNETRIRSKPLR